MALNIAHRGGADLWPENTMAAFAGAIACGADGAELDVHLSRDGEVIVFHDEALKPEIVRESGGRWLAATGPLLKDLSYAELKLFDVGRLKPGTAYARRHPRQEAHDGERIPRLADVIALAKAGSPSFQLWIELKTDLLNGERGADPVALADAALDVVETSGFAPRTVFVSFDWRSLKRVRQRAPGIRIYATTLPRSWFEAGQPPPEDGPPPPAELAQWRHAWAGGAPWEAGANSCAHASYPEAVAVLGADGWFPFHRDVTPESMAKARSCGLAVAAWTVPAKAQNHLISLGVGAICTDDPTTFGNITS
jgi:glycerophosphoryl diester phosphodiesterase